MKQILNIFYKSKKFCNNGEKRLNTKWFNRRNGVKRIIYIKYIYTIKILNNWQQNSIICSFYRLPQAILPTLPHHQWDHRIWSLRCPRFSVAWVPCWHFVDFHYSIVHELLPIAVENCNKWENNRDWPLQKIFNFTNQIDQLPKYRTTFHFEIFPSWSM